MDMNTRSLFQKYLWGFILLLLVSCSDADLNEAGAGDSHNQQCAISEIGAQTVTFNLKYDVPDGYRVAFEVYAENPLKSQDGLQIKKTDVLPMLTGITNGRGE